MQKVLHAFDILNVVNDYLTFNDIKNIVLLCKNIKVNYNKRVLIKYEKNTIHANACILCTGCTRARCSL